MKMDKLNIRTMKLADLNPAKYNPRKELKPGDSEFEKLKNSIQNFGYVELIVVNEANDNTVISGHQRLSVLKHLGETEAECVIVNMNEADEKALNIAMNKVSGEWDTVKLADLLDDLKSLDYDLEFTGFDAAEIDDLFSNVHDKNIKEDDFDIDEALKKPNFSKAGDLWFLGKHKVLCGDSTLQESFDKLLGDEKVNLVLTDMPYFVSYKGKAGTIKNDDLGDEEAYQFSLRAMNCMHDAMANDASIYIFHSDSKGLIFRRAFHDAGFYLSSCCIWEKDSLVLGRSPYQWISESILFGWRRDGKHKWYAGRSEVNVWHFPKPKKNSSHPTIKPVPLMAYPMKNSTQTNGIVLDPFLGSGSTMIACEESGRICRGMELDTKYMDVIVRRWTQYRNGNWSDVKCIRDGHEYTLEEIVAQMDEPCSMDDFVNGVDGSTAE
ncbi:MAG: site-specific DNA-methyltransferase [Lachnospiraceae bacterium]|nr:site-specific DNA-methyltransferase [Lachnospiraceae bacterium]